MPNDCNCERMLQRNCFILALVAHSDIYKLPMLRESAKTQHLAMNSRIVILKARIYCILISRLKFVHFIIILSKLDELILQRFNRGDASTHKSRKLRDFNFHSGQ